MSSKPLEQENETIAENDFERYFNFYIIIVSILEVNY